MCGIHIITLRPIIANILALLAVHWCGYRVISCKPGYFTDSSSIGRVRQCTFLNKSSDIHGRLVMNEDLYDTGSAVVGLYRLFTNFLKFPWESPRLGGSIWGGVLGTHT